MTKKLLALTLLGTATLIIAGCGLDVYTDADGSKTVNIDSPFGSVNVNTDVPPSKTGLSVYPGARVTKDGGDTNNSADVNVSGGHLFGMQIVAAEMESEDAPQAILEFYKREMQKYGPVTECRGDIDFKGRNEQHLVCEDKPWEHQQQLVVGTASEHRIVSVKPHGSGSEFAMVFIQTGRKQPAADY